MYWSESRSLGGILFCRFLPTEMKKALKESAISSLSEVFSLLPFTNDSGSRWFFGLPFIIPFRICQSLLQFVLFSRGVTFCSVADPTPWPLAGRAAPQSADLTCGHVTHRRRAGADAGDQSLGRSVRAGRGS